MGQRSEVRGRRTGEDGGRMPEVGGHPGEIGKKKAFHWVKKSGKLPDPKVPGLYRFGDTRNACSDISKIRGLGWEPEMTPNDSVREYVEWLYAQDNVEDILAYAEKTMKDMDVVRRAEGC